MLCYHKSSLIPPLEETDVDVAVVVDERLQDEFFKKISNQLQSINQFFKKEESRLEFSLSELEDQVSWGNVGIYIY